MVDTQVRSLPITAQYPLNDDGLQNRAPLYVAFMAAYNFLRDLEHDGDYYKRSPPPPIPAKYRRFPNVRGLRRVSGSNRLDFQITEILGDSTKGRYIYVALTSGPKPEKIVVKFTRKYGKELHEFCADQNYSPKLLAYERLPGDWIGVAMEFVASACHFFESKFIQECGRRWLEEMDKMVAAIHGAGYVHGDLRPPNFVVDGKKLLLIDFDWGGNEGDAMFPDIELQRIIRIDRNDTMITKEHDQRVLMHTKAELQRCLS